MDRTTAPGSTSARLFTAGNPFAGVPPTLVDAEWLNGVQEELVGIIEAAGLPPNSIDHGQLQTAILLLTGNDGGSLDVIRAGSSGAHASPVFRRDQPGPICLFSAGFQKNPNASIIAGETSGPPVTSPQNTVDANGYDGSGADDDQPGHCWPYQTIGAQMLGDATVNNGWFPRCEAGRGLNDYYYPDFAIGPGMMGMGGGRVVIEVFGILDVNAASGLHHLEVALTRQIKGGWNSGDGGSHNVVGGFTGNKSFAFVSPAMDGATFGTAKAMHLTITLESFFKRSVVATCRFLCTAFDGSSAPVFDSTHSAIMSYGGATSFAQGFNHFKLYFKVDQDDGAGTYDALQVNNTPFGGPGSNPPNAAQDGSAITFAMSHARADYYPPAS